MCTCVGSVSVGQRSLFNWLHIPGVSYQRHSMSLCKPLVFPFYNYGIIIIMHDQVMCGMKPFPTLFKSSVQLPASFISLLGGV